MTIGVLVPDLANPVFVAVPARRAARRPRARLCRPRRRRTTIGGGRATGAASPAGTGDRCARARRPGPRRGTRRGAAARRDRRPGPRFRGAPRVAARPPRAARARMRCATRSRRSAIVAWPT